MATPVRACLAILTCSIAFLLAACGPGDAPRVGVSGTVKYMNLLLAKGTIQFTPKDTSKGSSGGSDVIDGQYSISEQQGLLPGTYVITISAADPKKRQLPPDAPPGAVYEANELIPEKYNKRSILIEEVTVGGPNVFHFDLK